MVVVQVGAHHHVDVLGPRAGAGEPLRIVGVEVGPERPVRLELVVAAAGVDQDVLIPDPQQPAVHAELDQPAVRLVVVRRKPVRVLPVDLVAPLGKDLRRRVGRQIGFLDARHADLADRKDRHFRLPGPMLTASRRRRSPARCRRS
jgi:hypothetical protein